MRLVDRDESKRVLSKEELLRHERVEMLMQIMLGSKHINEDIEAYYNNYETEKPEGGKNE
uniref:Uncharacterized protein n=1 Tax=viral metagenome TaxID=1070528 RepID=A0A6M3J104_9ZZZZ